VAPSCLALLRDSLTYERRIQQSGDARDVVYKTVALYRPEADGLLIPAGMTERVIRRLTNAGLKVEIEDRRPQILPEPVYENVDPLRPGQDELLSTIIAHDHGVICAPTGAGKSWLIRQICKMWPEARIIICSPFSGIIRQTFRELQMTMGLNEVGQVGDGFCNPERRVVCAVSNSLAKCELRKCQIFLFDEVHRAGSDKLSEVICRIDNARMYGFSASPHGRSDNTDMEVEAAFGPIIATVDYQDVQKTGGVVPIEVRVYSCAGMRSDEFSTTTSMERHMLWRNKERNKLIQRVVQDIIRTSGDDVQILISVAKVEHAVNLGKLLPDFQLVYRNMDPGNRVRWERDGLIPTGVHPLSAKRRAEVEIEFREGKLKRAIATYWSTGMDFPQLNVLVRADAAGGKIANTQIPGRVTRPSEGKSVGIVIDLDDSFHPNLSKRALGRFAQYRKKGWTVTRTILPPEPQVPDVS
jgi:superfamily II DNA or RNA helicase